MVSCCQLLTFTSSLVSGAHTCVLGSPGPQWRTNFLKPSPGWERRKQTYCQVSGSCASAPSPISALGAAEPSRYRVGLTQDVCQRAQHLLMSFCYLEELLQAWGVGTVPAVVSSVPRATCKRRAEVPWHLGQTPCEPCGLHEPCYCHRTVHSGSALRARPKWVPINRVSPKTGSLALPDTTFLRVTWDLSEPHFTGEGVPDVHEGSIRLTGRMKLRIVLIYFNYF